jgi:hypothetical protein
VLITTHPSLSDAHTHTHTHALLFNFANLFQHWHQLRDAVQLGDHKLHRGQEGRASLFLLERVCLAHRSYNAYDCCFQSRWQVMNPTRYVQGDTRVQLITHGCQHREEMYPQTNGLPSYRCRPTISGRPGQRHPTWALSCPRGPTPSRHIPASSWDMHQHHPQRPERQLQCSHSQSNTPGRARQPQHNKILKRPYLGEGRHRCRFPASSSEVQNVAIKTARSTFGRSE